MSELQTSSDQLALAGHQPDELLLEALDEQALQSARARNAARMRFLWHSRKFLVCTTLLGLVLSTAFAFLIPKRYRSTAELMPPNGNLGSGAEMLAALSDGVGGGLASMAESALKVKTSGALFIGIVTSDTVRDDLIHKFGLQKIYHDRYLEDARKDLAAHTNVSEDDKSGIISISVTDRSPQRAAAMVQEYVSELNWVVIHLNTSSAHRERAFLDQRLRQVEAGLEDAEKQFSQFASQKGAIDVPAQSEAMVSAAAQLQGELIAAQSELQSLQQTYTDQNVRVRSLQARVNELQSALGKLAGKGADDKSSADQIYPSLRQLPLLGVTYADLLRQTKVEQTVFQTLTQQDELAKVEEAKDTPSVTVLDPPLVPENKSFPPRLFIMGLGTFLAFLCGIAWVLANSAWAAVDPGDPRKALAVEVWSDMRSGLLWNSNNGSVNGGPKDLQYEIGRKQETESGK